MQNFTQDSSPKTPALNFDLGSGVFEITGRSIPENSIDFYKPLMAWLDQYIASPLDETKLKVKLEYFNTSSSKILVEIFRKLEKVHKAGKRVTIDWYYEEEDEDMLDSGEDFKDIISLPINLIQISAD